MSNFDDLFRQEQGQAAPISDQPFDKEAWAQKKQEQREVVYTMIDETATAMARDGDTFQKYLDVQSRFDRYSVSNALLILVQRPNATVIKDFDTWKDQGAYIRKKESGFYIIEPGEEYQRQDGSTGISYNPKKMFDISQTGNSRKRETPIYPDERTRIKALLTHAPVPVRISDTLPSGVNALYQPDTREIQIRRGLDANHIFRALAQELAQAEMDKGNGSYNRSEYGFHAYCASYMLCKQYGVETNGFYHFEGVPQRLETLEPQEIRAELTTIKEAAGEISGRMNRMLNQQRQQKRQEPER
ncbi:ArdC-like ssDNA-binding domain-containing protein [Dehalobacterium formicoaceticum]|uniref:ArdC-like ssDNA-binding domain-containing protein n=1 Tax=Dehalobacterium formicoaceticum TaxID=51515 RepID=UPI000B7EA7DA|nr:ArdC-like ssDNA-binding domain-containing protein [Dehalobacterium formicoaceticum]